jgi:succinate dehydrogenase / fumarate reductase cytochrome b subunit
MFSSTSPPASVESGLIVPVPLPQADCQPARISVVTAKLVMAATGIGLLGFVVGHLLGNLQIFLGQEALNSYAKFLKGMPLLLWTARLGLLAVFTVHVALAFYLKRLNRRARPQRYVIEDPVETSLASRTMLTSGLVILAFLIYHLLHFTLGVTDPQTHGLVDSAGRHDVYSMVVLSFRNVYVSTAYIAAMLMLGLHLSHATSSMLQTLGVVSQRTRRGMSRLGVVVAVVLALGNISIPLSILFGWLGLPGEGGTP